MRARRTDANQAPIVEALRAMGFSVAVTSSAGNGIPDTWLGKWGFCVPLEIKTEDGTLTKKQIDFIATWRGPSVVIAKTLDEALDGFLRAFRKARDPVSVGGTAISGYQSPSRVGVSETSRKTRRAPTKRGKA